MSAEVGQLHQFRPYLLFLARMSWDDRLQAKLDPSDLVQQTLLQATASFDQFRGTTEEELAGWLRQILARVVAERQRYFGREKRAHLRERSLQAELAESSRRLSAFPAADPSPPQRVEFDERAIRVAAAIESLPETQRGAITLHYWQGRSIPEIAEIMQRSHSAVGGLVHRGLRRLREELAELQ